jgi:hypothetical protein
MASYMERLLGAQPSSAAREHQFSKAGLAIDKLRQNKSDLTVDDEMLIARNPWCFPDLFPDLWPTGLVMTPISSTSSASNAISPDVVAID